MAYSGLGAGTISDPYQITTVSQFKEMDNAAYAGVYFLLMNDLDFAAESGVSFTNFYCKFDGGGYKVDNIQLYTNGFVTLRSDVWIKNVQLVFNRFYSANLPIFISASYVNTVVLSGLNITCLNKNGHSVKMLSAYLSNTCVISDITAIGKFSEIIYVSQCSLSKLRIYNTILEHVPILVGAGAGITFNQCVYFKPFTKTNSSASMGLFVDSPINRTIIAECAVIANKFISETTSYNSIGGFVGRGEMEIRNSYVVGSFQAKFGYYFHALYGSYSNSNCIFENNYFYGDLISTVKADTSVVSALPSTGCYYCKELLTNQDYGDVYATNLTVAQFKNPSNFTLDFVSVWQQGDDRPLLINTIEDSSLFYQEEIYDTDPIVLGAIQKISATHYSVEVLTNNTKNFGVDITEFASILDYKLNESGALTFTTDKDIEAIVKTYYLIQNTKIYTDSKNYYHLYLEQIPITDVVVDNYNLLQSFPNTASYVHGTALIGDYLYGSSRGGISNDSFPIVKALASDVSDFELFPISATSERGARKMDSLVEIGGKLYTVAADNYQKIYMIVFDLITDSYQSYLIGDGEAYGGPSCTDGLYLYVWLPDPSRICKIDVSVFNSIEKYNTSAKWAINSVDLPYSGSILPHTMVVDGENLYVGMGTASLTTLYELWKIDKSTMAYIGKASVPKMTDDMCQTDTHLFIGIEPYNSTSVGFNIGACAIRKSDLRVTQIRKLHTSDTADVSSYASLIFGNYLIDIKTNSHIYAVDISGVDNWNNDSIGAHTLKVYRMLQPDGITPTKPINEVYLTESGKFIGFAWDVFSYITSFDLPGLDYFSEPTVITNEAIIVGENGASLSGFITNTGGKKVTAVGVTLGQAADLSDGVDYPVTPVSTEFEKAFNDLEYGTYYFRTYATNAEGTGYGEIKSFTLEIPYTEPGQPTALDKTIQAEITASWTAPIDDGGTPIIGYRIERKLSGGEWEVIVANTGNANTTYTETLPQGAYQYRVSAITAYATSQSSATLDVNAVVGGVGKYRIFLGSTEITTVE